MLLDNLGPADSVAGDSSDLGEGFIGAALIGTFVRILANVQIGPFPLPLLCLRRNQRFQNKGQFRPLVGGRKLRPLFALLRPLWRILGGGGILGRGSLCGRLGGVLGD